MNLQDLKKPFPVDKVEFRIGSRNKDKTQGIGLAYIDARDVMERLDSVCGVESWQALYPHANGKTSCKIGIKVPHVVTKDHNSFIEDEWVWKENGAGDTDIEGEKGAFSDAFKRSAVLWGIGRYLYYMPNTWVDLTDEGRKFSKDGLKTLRNALSKLSQSFEMVEIEPMDTKVEPKAFKRLISEINQLTTPPDANLWWKRNESVILSLDEFEQIDVDEAFKSKINRLQSGDTEPGTWVFKDTPDSNKWGREFVIFLENCKSVVAVDALVRENKKKLEALLGTVDGVSNKIRMQNKIDFKKNSFDLTEAG